MHPVRGPSGVTLVELMVVIALASVVALGLLGFYLNSQATWIDASTKVLAQRDATLLASTIASRAHAAASIDTDPTAPEPTLILRDRNDEFYRFWLESSDGLVHQAQKPSLDDGAVVSTKVDSFVVSVNADTTIVHLRLKLRSASEEPVGIATSIGLYNR